MLVLKNVSIFDGVSETLMQNCSVLIDGEKILEVREHDNAAYENCESIDLTGKVVMPGLIDGHMHCLGAEVPQRELVMEDKTPGGAIQENAQGYSSFRSAYSTRKVLDAGVTTVFDGGAPYFLDVALRESLQRGLFPGPDYYISGKHISVGAPHHPGLGVIANGPWEMRKAVREMLWWGVDHLKLKVSAPMRMGRRNVSRSEMSIEEIQAVCDEAHSAGRPVGAHALGAEPIKDFMKGGGDWIIHGTGIDDEGIEMMLKQNKYFFATLQASSKYPPSAEFCAAKTVQVVEMVQKRGQLNFDTVQKVHKAGVNVVFATDTGGLDIWPGISVGKEMFLLKEAGMSNAEVLRAATSVAAKAVRLDDLVGTVKTGYKANLIVVDDNPVQKLETMLDVGMVFKAGKVVKNRLPVVIPAQYLFR